MGLSATVGTGLSCLRVSERLEYKHVFGIEEQEKNSVRQKQKVKLQTASVSRVVLWLMCVFCNVEIITGWLFQFATDY